MSIASGSSRSCVGCGRRGGSGRWSTIHPRYRWRYLSGYVHPASGRTQWHLGSGVTVELFTHSLAAFAAAGGSWPGQGDRAGLGPGRLAHESTRRHSAAPASRTPPPLHPRAAASRALVDLLQHAPGQWRPADLDELDTRQLEPCAALQTDPALVAILQSATHYHWWPADYSPIT